MALSTSIVRRTYDRPTDDRLEQFSPNGESEPEEEGIHERIAQSDGTGHEGARGNL
jgi:hypothetical protein